MAEPTITPTEYWPDMEAFELRMYSFVYVGWGMSIRTDEEIVWGWVIEDGKIEIDGVQHDVRNFWIRAIHDSATGEWSIYFVFGDETPIKPIFIKSVDGNDPKISLYGNWYFQSTIYTGQQVTTSEYEFDFQRFIFDSNAAILCYMGLLILGAIVAKRMGGLGIYDMIVLLFAGICGFVLMVG